MKIQPVGACEQSDGNGISSGKEARDNDDKKEKQMGSFSALWDNGD